MTITHTINVLELVWTLIAVVGFFYMAKLFYRSYQDREWLVNSSVNGDRHTREYVATTSILLFLGGLITQSAYTAAGIVAMTAPNKNSSTHPSVQGISTAAIFIFASVASTVMAKVIYERRTKVVRLIVEEYVRREHE